MRVSPKRGSFPHLGRTFTIFVCSGGRKERVTDLLFCNAPAAGLLSLMLNGLLLHLVSLCPIAVRYISGRCRLLSTNRITASSSLRSRMMTGISVLPERSKACFRRFPESSSYPPSFRGRISAGPRKPKEDILSVSSSTVVMDGERVIRVWIQLR